MSFLRRFSFALAILLAAACSHKPPAPQPSPMTPPYVGTTPQPPPQTTPAPTPAPVKPVEKVHVALALGGAGVASFATVGLLKRLTEEGIVVDYIVTTGWPTLFCLGYGFLGSVHDLEWFAMRLGEKDFYKAAGLFGGDNEYQTQEALSQLIQSSFKQRDLGESKTPIIVAATNSDVGDPETYERGDWRDPLLKTMAVPGIYRPYPKGHGQWVQSLQGIEVEEALRRGARTVIAVQMYPDYIASVSVAGKPGTSEAVFRQLYLTQLRKSLQGQMKRAAYGSEIRIGKPPNDFSAKRSAIQAGYKEGAKIARMLINGPPG